MRRVLTSNTFLTPFKRTLQVPQVPLHARFTTKSQPPTSRTRFGPQFYAWCGVAGAIVLYSTTTKESHSDSKQPSTGNKFKFQHGATVFPHPEKEYKGGEDANFVSDNAKVIGVADGVGGWASKGVDPAIYAKALMEGSRLFANANPNIVDPVLIMDAGYKNAAQHLGSSTCCIVVLEGSQLNSANLGDSGFMIVRGDKILYRTKEQQHRFNFPFQLGNNSRDKPQHSNVDKIQVQSGDIVIVGTDGLFDNLYDTQILSCVIQNKKSGKAQVLSEAVAKLARENAARRSGTSPFSEGSTAYGPILFDISKDLVKVEKWTILRLW